MDIYEIRKANLVSLIGKQKKASCAARWDMSPAHLSQILSDRTAKNIGDEIARRVEEAERLPRGWMDSPQDELARTKVWGTSLQGHSHEIQHLPQIPIQIQGDTASYVDLPHLDVSASMGSGAQPPTESPEVIRTMSVHVDWFRSRGVSYSSIGNLAIITGDGDSMAGTFSDGDSLLVDRGVNEIRADAIYVFSYEGHLFVKRLQRMTSGALRIISDNAVYPSMVIEGPDLDKVHIHARVLLAWNARKL